MRNDSLDNRLHIKTIGGDINNKNKTVKRVIWCFSTEPDVDI